MIVVRGISLSVLLAVVAFLVAIAGADEGEPETAAQLRMVEKQVQIVFKKVAATCVAIETQPKSALGMTSGVIVSADGIMLTTADSFDKPGQICEVIMLDGRRLKAKSLGRSQKDKCGIIKITGEGPFPFAEKGDSARMKVGSWCVALGHPGGFDPARGVVLRLGRLLEKAGPNLRTECLLIGGDPGGPLFDLQGKVIGIHSHLGPKMTQNFHVSIDTFGEHWERLLRGDSW